MGGWGGCGLVWEFPSNSSFSSVSVRCRRAFSFKRRLTDTCVIGNLPKVGTGFVEIHGSLREIPEGDEKTTPPHPLLFRTLFRLGLSIVIITDINPNLPVNQLHESHRRVVAGAVAAF